ncbi:HD family phosphohydrolase [Gloeocapsa sp. PCC 73106]|uniref:HD family phosphohydrolase n=1 Tax=Gloeocapsa sp. PCC 73106 TaxID=102232 RepID=UPI0002ABAAD4|nr:HDIG domain-containing metalloprotein [Gloeocapsa sp. PCC 73106]ELR98921.1 putative domain HDIG-containing protein [Gloeocapsa sp. PCC 73106]
MNIYSFTHQLGQWLQKHSDNYPVTSHKKAYQINKKCAIAKVQPPLMLALAIASFTGVLGNRFYNQPELAKGTIAPKTYLAPNYTTIVDTQETDKLRKQARNATIPILKKDTEITEQVINNIQNYLLEIEVFRKSVGTLPFLDNINKISLGSQIYLRHLSESEWENILEKVEQKGETIQIELDDLETKELNLPREQIIATLQYYKQKFKSSDYQELLNKIRVARQRYQSSWENYAQSQTLQLTDEEKRIILEQSEETWQKTEAIIRRTTRRILTQGIAQGIPDDLIQETINLHLNIGVEGSNQESSSEEIPETAKSVASSIIIKFIEPNLMIDEEQTAARAERAAEAIADQLVYVKQGEIIIKQDEEISHQQFLKLDEFGLSRRGINQQGIWKAGAIATLGVTILWISQKKARLPFRCRNQILLCLLSLSAPVLTIFSIPYTNLPAIGLLSSSFYGPTVALTQVGISAVLVIFADESVEGKDWEPLATGVVGGIIAALVAGRMRDRDKLAKLGLIIGLTQFSVYLIIRLISTASPTAILFTSVQQAIVHGLFAGLGWSVVALGISPYLERLFDLLTPSRLAELSNINQPLLKKLAEEAPGTWQHTLFVSSLAEGAGRQLNCNVELIRAGTLYHDIGKLHDPLGFIENQRGGPNKHEEINDPWKSVEIIKKHVSQGLVMARRHQLPRAICDFIPQHQGTMLIAYFYFQAKKQAEEKGDPEIAEPYFRYDGPIPQSREAGIMMLADSCEAALRCLENATKEQALVMIQKILKARWQDAQLLESGLKYEELPLIAQVFVDVWEQSKHRRIAYPKAALEVPLK